MIHLSFIYLSDTVDYDLNNRHIFVYVCYSDTTCNNQSDETLTHMWRHRKIIWDFFDEKKVIVDDFHRMHSSGDAKQTIDGVF